MEEARTLVTLLVCDPKGDRWALVDRADSGTPPLDQQSAEWVVAFIAVLVALVLIGVVIWKGPLLVGLLGDPETLARMASLMTDLVRYAVDVGTGRISADEALDRLADAAVVAIGPLSRGLEALLGKHAGEALRSTVREMTRAVGGGFVRLLREGLATLARVARTIAESVAREVQERVKTLLGLPL